MVVEHIFITTLERIEALSRAAQFLNSRGFQASPQAAFALGGEGWSVVEMTRGKKNPARAKSAVELPQQIRLEWDRARVTVAASSTSMHESRATTSIGGRGRKRIARDQQAILTAIVTALQDLLEAQLDPAQLSSTNAAFEGQIHATERSRRKRNAIIGFSILAIFIGILVALGINANSR
jgi:hypothetical protein